MWVIFSQNEIIAGRPALAEALDAAERKALMIAVLVWLFLPAAIMTFAYILVSKRRTVSQ
jgi:hypothetical protein